MFMRVLILFLFIVNGFVLYAQKSLEGGLLAGGFYYLGEVNPSTQFHSTKFGGGIFFRQNLNKRWAVRAHVATGTLSATDVVSDYSYQKARNYSFNTPLMEVLAQAEFNFLPYKLGSERYTSPITPYFASGIGFLLVSNSSKPYNITIPLSVGFKFSVSKKMELGLEWSFRKTFSDYLDNLSGKQFELESMDVPSKGEYKQQAFYFDKDWYSFAGIFITYKIFQSGSVCKAYDF